ncbi:unnamed protein product [Peniophora sp. CBMAI 1063]|nr:unnamed protein product [Peniophora sp. CBMAI 1063]
MGGVVTLAALRVGLNSSAYIKRANCVPPAPGKGQDVLTYISKVWPKDQVDAWIGFCSELALYKGARYLRPLQGDIVPRVLGVYTTDSGFALNMEAPHPVFWLEASAAMPDVLKAKVVSAYSDLHSCGVLHGDIALRHILVGGDARVTIIDFQESRALVDDDAVGLGRATQAELAVEMRRVRYILDFEGARAYETSKTRREAERRKRNKDRARRRERCRIEGLPVEELRPVTLPTDDVSAPPIHPEELREWKRSCQSTPTRVVMPEISEGQLSAAVSEFIGIVKQMVEGDASWSLSSQSSASAVSQSPSPLTLEHPLPSRLSAPDTTKLTDTERANAASLDAQEPSGCRDLVQKGDVQTGSPPPENRAEISRDSSQATSPDNCPSISVTINPPVSSAIKRPRDPSDTVDSGLEVSPSKRSRRTDHRDKPSSLACVVQATTRAGSVLRDQQFD